jgi:hypothetical protein
LTKKAPYKGLGAESEEKREPASDIDTGVVDGLKALDPDGRLEKRSGRRADIGGCLKRPRSGPTPFAMERSLRVFAGFPHARRRG